MGRRKKPFYEKVRIENIAAEGKAIARINDVVVFVPQAIPGDIVDIQVKKKRKRYQEGFITKFHQYSDLRIEPFCKHFGTCGGCKWQHLPYAEQLNFKQQQVNDQLTRIGGVELGNISPIIGSEKTKYYRNKLEYTFSDKRWLTEDEIEKGDDIIDRNALGYHVPGRFDKVLDIEECFLQPDPSNQIRLAVKEFCNLKGFDFFDIREQQGLMRNLIIRTSSTGELMVIFSFFKDDHQKINVLLNHIKDLFPSITSLMYVINPKGNSTINDLDIKLFDGRDHIFEQMENLKFKIGPKSFYQTNSAQAYNLYKVASDFAELTSKDVVYDLYTGTGTIANFIAKKVKKVIGIEYVPEAIEDANINSDINQINNTSFFAGDMKDVLNDTFISVHGKPDVIITDPPRAGMHKDVIDTLMRIESKRIVYVSCNPATQARDLQLLSDKYHVTRVQPVDMFPHTHHVENVVLLEQIA